MSIASASSAVSHQPSSTSRATVRTSGFGRPDAVFSFRTPTRGACLRRVGARASLASDEASSFTVDCVPLRDYAVALWRRSCSRRRLRRLVTAAGCCAKAPRHAQRARYSAATATLVAQRVLRRSCAPLPGSAHDPQRVQRLRGARQRGCEAAEPPRRVQAAQHVCLSGAATPRLARAQRRTQRVQQEQEREAIGRCVPPPRPRTHAPPPCAAPGIRQAGSGGHRLAPACHHLKPRSSARVRAQLTSSPAGHARASAPLTSPLRGCVWRRVSMPFGLLVCGPPGSGKSTFCNGLQHYLTLAGAAAPQRRAIAALRRQGGLVR